jgi:ADP-dependent NAD(P)H-hydrate dehydratase / NAD(P)H-hydrate epimerase
MEITGELVRSLLPPRPDDSNKGTFGRVLIIAGSEKYPGAAILSVMSCARIGAGLVTLAADEYVYKTAVPKIPFATFLKLSEINDSLDKYDVVVIGPGLGLAEDRVTIINNLLKSEKIREKKLILDADALNILAKKPEWYKILPEETVITPHPGEMSRLTGLSVDEIQNKREEVALEYSKKWKVTVVLKGAKTVVAGSSGEHYVNPFSNPLLAAAGTGDVLSGIISGLAAQGLDVLNAAIAGVYIHAVGGEILKEKFGDSGATALDLTEALPLAVKNLKTS